MRKKVLSTKNTKNMMTKKNIEDNKKKDKLLQKMIMTEKARQERVAMLDKLFTKVGHILMYIAKENNSTYVTGISRGTMISLSYVQMIVDKYEKVGVLKTEKIGSARKVQIAKDYEKYVEHLLIMWQMKRDLM